MVGEGVRVSPLPIKCLLRKLGLAPILTGFPIVFTFLALGRRLLLRIHCLTEKEQRLLNR